MDTIVIKWLTNWLTYEVKSPKPASEPPLKSPIVAVRVTAPQQPTPNQVVLPPFAYLHWQHFEGYITSGTDPHTPSSLPPHWNSQPSCC